MGVPGVGGAGGKEKWMQQNKGRGGTKQDGSFVEGTCVRKRKCRGRGERTGERIFFSFEKVRDSAWQRERERDIADSAIGATVSSPVVCTRWCSLIIHCMRWMSLSLHTAPCSILLSASVHLGAQIGGGVSCIGPP